MSDRDGRWTVSPDGGAVRGGGADHTRRSGTTGAVVASG